MEVSDTIICLLHTFLRLTYKRREKDCVNITTTTSIDDDTSTCASIMLLTFCLSLVCSSQYIFKLKQINHYIFQVPRKSFVLRAIFVSAFCHLLFFMSVCVQKHPFARLQEIAQIANSVCPQKIVRYSRCKLRSRDYACVKNWWFPYAVIVRLIDPVINHIERVGWKYAGYVINCIDISRFKVQLLSHE